MSAQKLSVIVRLLTAWLLLAPPSAVALGCEPARYDQSVVLEFINDGDTLTLTDGRLVRLTGVDAPEIHHRQPHNSQPYALEARALLRQHLYPGQRLHLGFDRVKLDPFGRTLAYVYTDQGRHIQELLLSKGLARARVYRNDRFWQCFNRIERLARQAGSGLWSSSGFQPRRVEDLIREDGNHWREIYGRLNRIEKKGRYLRLVLDENFYVDIPKSELGNFSTVLTGLSPGSPLFVRGKLYYSYRKWRLIAAHPSQISLENLP